MRGWYQWALIRLLWHTLFVILASPQVTESKTESTLLIFNTREDLLRGDIWETISLEEVKKYIYTFPDDFQVIGIGTTNKLHHMGQVVLRGSARKTNPLWFAPEYPYQVKHEYIEDFPWLQLAIVDPQDKLVLNLKKTKDLHSALVERLHKNGINICAAYIEAIAGKVEYNLTNWIPKRGLGKHELDGKSSLSQAFKDVESAKWVFFGIYLDEQTAGPCCTVQGQPLLIIGYNLEKKNGGLVQSARINDARVELYPIGACLVFQSDLKVVDVLVSESKVTIDIENAGEMTAEHVSVRLKFPESNREMDVTLPSLKPSEKKNVVFRPQEALSDKHILVQIDPDNEIFESNEDNNLYEKKFP
jgi:hypothetical protein